MSAFFGTKPRLVQAIQWLGNNANAIREFAGGSVSVLNAELLEVYTEAGPFKVRVGEYLLQTESGFMVCPEAVFNLAFEAVDVDEIPAPAQPVPPAGEPIDVPPAPPGAEPPAVFEPVPAPASVPVVPATPPATAPAAPAAAGAPIIPASAAPAAPQPSPDAPAEPPFTSTPQ